MVRLRIFQTFTFWFFHAYLVCLPSHVIVSNKEKSSTLCLEISKFTFTSCTFHKTLEHNLAKFLAT